VSFHPALVPTRAPPSLLIRQGLACMVSMDHRPMEKKAAARLHTKTSVCLLEFCSRVHSLAIQIVLPYVNREEILSFSTFPLVLSLLVLHSFLPCTFSVATSFFLFLSTALFLWFSAYHLFTFKVPYSFSVTTLCENSKLRSYLPRTKRNIQVCSVTL
jgi:hypothetical protein